MNANNVMYLKIAVCAFSVVCLSSWLIFALTAAKIYKFFVEFEKFKAQNDVELNSMVWSSRKLEAHMLKIIAELQITNRLLYEIDRNKSVKTEAAEIEYDTEDSLRHRKGVDKPSPLGNEGSGKPNDHPQT